jgi:L-alanine-DL-glutamate epimerase-like enolase superfamily enzyme
VTTAGDGSQDALLVRVAAGGEVGWGECEASPLVSIAAFVAPMSHGACRPVGASVLGQNVETPADIARIAATVEWDSMDLLQAPHTWSGIEMALWDLLGKTPRRAGLANARLFPPRKEDALRLPALRRHPQETLELARKVRREGYRAAKFGWGPIGRAGVAEDADHFTAAREGLGPDGILLVDVGQIFGEDVERAAARLPALEEAGAVWLEEPFHGSAYAAYGELARRSPKVKLAGGEAAHNFHMARNLIDFGGIGYVQIDCGRIGGIGPAKKVADYAVSKGVTYVNHTFTSHLALSASIQPYAGLAQHEICEYPVSPKAVAVEITRNHLTRDGNGQISVPEAPGLGMEVNPDVIRSYGVDVELKVRGKTIFRSLAAA